MSESNEVFMEDISLLPGWILRNLSLMREIDRKSNDIQIILEEKRSKYLNKLSKKVNFSSQNIEEDINVPQIDEINELQKELKVLLKEKIAISDQSVHFIRYDGEILKKHYEQLRESLAESYLNNNECSSTSNYSGRPSFQNQINFKNSNAGSILRNMANNHNINDAFMSRNSISTAGDSNNNWNSESHPGEPNIGSPNKSSFSFESSSRPSKRRRSSAIIHAKDTLEQVTKAINTSVDISNDTKASKSNLSNDDKRLCSICEGTELINNKLVQCNSCSNHIHITCSWTNEPYICRDCCKKCSIQPSSAYDIEYSISHMNTPKSDSTKISKSSRKK